MGSFSDFLENAVLDYVFGDTVHSPNEIAATVYLALYTASPSDAGGGTEVSTGGYAREAITNDTTNFPDSVAGTKSNALSITMGFTPSVDLGTIVAYALFDSLTGGNILCWSGMQTPKIVYTGDPIRFPIGSLVFSLD